MAKKKEGDLDGRGSFVEFEWEDGTMARTYKSDVKDEKAWKELIEEKRKEGSLHKLIEQPMSPEEAASVADLKETASLREQAARIDAFKPVGAFVEFEDDSGNMARIYRGDISAPNWDKIVQKKRDDGTFHRLNQTNTLDGKTSEAEPEEVSKNPDPRPKEGSRDRVVFKDGENTAVTYRGDMSDEEWTKFRDNAAKKSNFVRAYSGDTTIEAKRDPNVEVEVGELSRTMETSDVETADAPARSSRVQTEDEVSTSSLPSGPSARNPASFIPSLTEGVIGVPKTASERATILGEMGIADKPNEVATAMEGASAAPVDPLAPAMAMPSGAGGGGGGSDMTGASGGAGGMGEAPLPTPGAAPAPPFGQASFGDIGVMSGLLTPTGEEGKLLPKYGGEDPNAVPPQMMPPPAMAPPAGPKLPAMPQLAPMAEGADPRAFDQILANTEARQKDIDAQLNAGLDRQDANQSEMNRRALLMDAENQRIGALQIQAEQNKVDEANRFMATYNGAMDEVKRIANTSVDPGRYWKNQNIAQKALAVVAGFAFGFSGKGMEYLQRLDGLVEQDIRHQENDRTRQIAGAEAFAKGALIGRDFAMQKGASKQEVLNIERAQKYQAYEMWAKNLAQSTNNEQVRAQAMQLQEQMRGRIDTLRVQGLKAADERANNTNAYNFHKFATQMDAWKTKQKAMAGGGVKQKPLADTLKKEVDSMSQAITGLSQMKDIAGKYKGMLKGAASRVAGGVGNSIVGGVTGWGTDESSDKAVFDALKFKYQKALAESALGKHEMEATDPLTGGVFDQNAQEKIRKNGLVMARALKTRLVNYQKSSNGEVDLTPQIAEADAAIAKFSEVE